MHEVTLSLARLPALAILGALVLAYVIAYVVSIVRLRFFDKLAHIPGPSGLHPLFGDILTCVESNSRCLDRYKERLAAFGRIQRVPIQFGKTRLEVTDPDAFKHILVTNAANYVRGELSGCELLKVIVGDSSMTVTSGKAHMRARHVASPAFRSLTLPSFLPSIVECNRRLRDRLAVLCSEGSAVAPMRQYLNDFTLDVIGLVALGFDFCASLPERNAETVDYIEAFDTLARPETFLLSVCPGFETVAKALLSLPEWLLRLTPVTDLFRCIQCVVRLRRDIPKLVAAAASTRGSRSHILIDGIAKAQEGVALGDDELKDMIMTLIIAGHETTAIALSWLLLALSENPRWQQACRAEVSEKFHDDAPLTWDAVHELRVLAACFNETLRLYPPLPCANRMSVDADVIGDYAIPPRTDIFLLTAMMHRDPEIWQDPDEFRPERFLDAEGDDDVPWKNAFLPFGDGAFKCLGYRFATAQVLITVASLLREFEFERAPGPSYCEKANVSMVTFPDLELCVKRHAVHKKRTI